MKVILWIPVALVAAFAVLYLSVRQARRRLPPIVLPVGESMPATALQRLATRTLVIIGALTLLVVALVAYYGPLISWQSDSIRVTATVLLVIALAVFAFYGARVQRWSARDDGRLDERDRIVLASAPAGQAPALLVTLAVWMIALTETHRTTGTVPTEYLYLVFWSCVMVSVLALLAGVLLGYRRS